MSIIKIATWNVERLCHKNKLPLIMEICIRKNADIFVLTETDEQLRLDYRSCFKTPVPISSSINYRSSESRVSIFTNYEVIKQYHTFDKYTAICIEVATEFGNLLVYGVIMGIFGNRQINYKIDLPCIIADIARLTANGKSLCVCGDYNCSFSDNYYYTKDARLTLEKSFEKNYLELLTRQQPQCIDHIAISRRFIGESAVSVMEWNHEKKLSDHKGILANLY
ncbi:MAG: hypothetical protein RR710_05750 [Oscillospiraceae bacterium]